MAAAKADLDVQSDFGSKVAGFSQRLIWRICDWRVLPQSVRQKLRKKFARKITGPFDVTCEAMNFRLYPAENYCDRVIFAHGKLPERSEHLALVPYIKPGIVFVDIGANVGSYSVFVGSRARGDATLFGLEPHPRTYEKLLFNLQANNLPTRHMLNCGAGEERSTLDLWSDGGSNIGHTSLLKAGTSNPKESVKVPVVPLLDLLHEQEIERIDILKIDVEGFEDRVLAPFFKNAEEALLPRHVLIETVHQTLWSEDLMAVLTQRGYAEAFRTVENRLLSRSSCS